MIISTILSLISYPYSAGMFVRRFIDASYANESSINNFTGRAVNPYIERFRTEYFMGGGDTEKKFVKRPFFV